MGILTVSQIFGSVSALVNQDQTQPVAGSTDYNLWMEFLQRAQIEWSESYDFEELRKTFYPTITGTGATIALPSDFKKVAGSPIYWNVNSNGQPWAEVLPEQRTLYSINDKYFYIMGNQNTGFNMLWNPPTLNSGSSVEIPYFAIPASLASSGQITVCPDSQFLADRVIAYVLEARYDSRFQEMEAKARERLMMMVENQNLKKYSSYATPAYVLSQTRKMGFRMGRD